MCLSNLYTRCEARPDSLLRERGKSLQFVKYLKGARFNGGVQRVEELIVVFNHNVINLYFTANKSTMHTSYYDKVYELIEFSPVCILRHFA